MAVYRPRRRDGRPDLAEAEAVFKAAAGLPRFVLLSSAAAHAPHHHNLGYVAETYRSQGANPIAAAWRELETRCAARLPQAETIVLRPRRWRRATAAILFSASSRPRRRGASRVRPGPAIPRSRGSRRGVALAVERGAGKPGVYHVAPRGAVSGAAPCAWRARGASR